MSCLKNSSLASKHYWANTGHMLAISWKILAVLVWHIASTFYVYILLILVQYWQEIFHWFHCQYFQCKIKISLIVIFHSKYSNECSIGAILGPNIMNITNIDLQLFFFLFIIERYKVIGTKCIDFVKYLVYFTLLKMKKTSLYLFLLFTIHIIHKGYIPLSGRHTADAETHNLFIMLHLCYRKFI